VASLAPVIAVDLGYAPAAVVVGGTWDCAFLLAARRFPRWGPDLFAVLQEWRERWPDSEMWCESTFSGPRWNRDTGRLQESQVVELASTFGIVYRTNALTGHDAFIGWDKLGRPALGEGPAGEHLRDACGVSCHALIDSRSGRPLWDFTTGEVRARMREEKANRRRGRARARR
jgi:hypothetical protein